MQGVGTVPGGVTALGATHVCIRAVGPAEVVAEAIANLENGPTCFVGDMLRHGPLWKTARSGLSLGPAPVLFAWTLGFFALCWVLLNLTPFGRHVRAVGGNLEAARHAGIGTGGVIIRVFMLSGGLAAFGGLMMAGRLSGGLPSVGVGMELDAIAAAVLGGTGFKGEGGSLVGTLFGALVMGTVINGLTLLGVNPYVQEIAKGVIIVVAVILVSLRK